MGKVSHNDQNESDDEDAAAAMITKISSGICIFIIPRPEEFKSAQTFLLLRFVLRRIVVIVVIISDNGHGATTTKSSPETNLLTSPSSSESLVSSGRFSFSSICTKA